ncbi:MAG: hypothetical protein KAI47_17660 [Deltaproteobacteria bacterium]|nr:hypothetical protein [Deltaproteobacteria bacterium]
MTKRIGLPGHSIVDLLPRDFKRKVRESIDANRALIEEAHEALGRVLSVTYMPLADIRQSFVFMVDQTDRTHAVERCRRYAKDLELINQKLTETQAQLVQSEKMAALGAFVAGVVHELNSPVGALEAQIDVMTRAAKMVKESVEDLGAEVMGTSRAKRAIRAIEESAAMSSQAFRRVQRVLASLKEFAQIDRSNVQANDIHRGIESTLELLNHKLEDRITVVRSFGLVPPVESVQGELNQVFMHILSNAAEAIDGKGVIYVRTGEEKGNAVIIVRDTGCGISEETLETLFTPLVEKKGARVAMHLGLATSYRILEAHHGSIALASEVGEGTTVTVRIPAVYQG